MMKYCNTQRYAERFSFSIGVCQQNTSWVKFHFPPLFRWFILLLSVKVWTLSESILYGSAPLLSPRIIYEWFILFLLSGGTRNFSVGGIEGTKCDSEGAKIQKIAENGWVWPFFSGGGTHAHRASKGGQMPLIPPLMPPLFLLQIPSYHKIAAKQRSLHLEVFFVSLYYQCNSKSYNPSLTKFVPLATKLNQITDPP